MSDPGSIFSRLWSVIEDRRAHPSEKSYTNKLLAGGLDAIGAKVREEADEIVAAAGEPGESGRDHTIREAADCFYHQFVLLAHRGIGLDEVEAELERRFGTSGLAEKASRPESDIESKPASDFPS